MAAFPTSRLVLFAKKRKDGTLSVALRVTYRRKSKYFFLNRHCSRTDWDAKSGRFKKSFPDHKQENDMLRTYEQRAASEKPPIPSNSPMCFMPSIFPGFKIRFHDPLPVIQASRNYISVSYGRHGGLECFLLCALPSVRRFRFQV